MSKADQTETIAYNLAAIEKMRTKAAVANVTGGTCPKCGEGANPTIVKNFGHCLKCQNAAWGR